MAFTPTSVIRKLANDKVDERHKLSEGQQLKQLIDNIQSSNQQQLARQKLQQQQQLQQATSLQHQQLQQQQQQSNMRPIVKSKLHLGVATVLPPASLCDCCVTIG